MKKCLSLIFLFCFAAGISAQNILSKGYKGHVEAGYSFGVGDYELGRMEINTSHGYQFNPYLFLGAGAGLHFMSSYESEDMDIALDVRDSQVDIPLFVNLRCNFTKKEFSPFVDLKGGTFITNNGGIYVNASIGLRYALNESQGVSFSIGYAYEKLEFETFDSFDNHFGMSYTRSPRKLNTEAFTIKLGYDF